MKHSNLKLYFHLFLWNRLHTLPRFFVEYWQLRQIKRVVGGAFGHVPFYREYYSQRGIYPDRVKKFDDIAKLPLTNKDIMRTQGVENVMRDSFPAPYYIWTQTSGSTGEPFRFPTSPLDLRTEGPWSRFYRFLIWQGKSITYARDDARVVQIGIRPSMFRKSYLFIPIADFIRNDAREVFRQVKTFETDMVASVATVLVELARQARNLTPEERPSFPYAVFYGEPLSDYQRKFVEDIFKCEVYGLYGAEEAGTIGIECASHDGFHTCDESLLVEILDDEGNIALPGSPGRVVITNFYNDVMPFIRYDLGDRGVMVQERCACGQFGQRLRIIGRGSGGFLTFGSRKFNYIELVMAMSCFSQGILRYQIAKTGKSSMEIRIIPADTSCAIDVKHIKKFFKGEFGLNPGIRIVPHLPYTLRGKTKVIVDET